MPARERSTRKLWPLFPCDGSQSNSAWPAGSAFTTRRARPSGTRTVQLSWLFDFEGLILLGKRVLRPGIAKLG